MSPRRVAAALAAGALLLGAALLPDFAPHIDSPKNWAEGEQNLLALRGGTPDPVLVFNQRHGAPFFIAAALSRELLAERLGWLDPVAARHAPLVPLAALFVAGLSLLGSFVLGAAAAPAGALLAFSYPELFGLLFNNLKDAPLVAFSSLSLVGFACWRRERRRGFLLAGYLFLALALCAKVYALYVPALLGAWALWLRLSPDGATPAPRGTWRWHAAGLLLVLALPLVLYAPAAWTGDPAEWLGGWVAWSRRMTVNPRPGSWGAYSFSQLALRAPLPLLAAAAGGAALALSRRPVAAIDRLLLLWLLLPLLPACVPGLYAYQSGMRLFIVVAVPLCLLAARGVVEAGALWGRLRGRDGRPAAAALAALALGAQLAGLAATHPYQGAYFNALAGGLGGAQAAGVPYAYDHVTLTYREAARWLDAHVEPGATVVAVQDAPWNWDLLRVSLRRRDLALRYVDRLDALAADGPLPAGAYVLCVWDFLAGAPGYELAYAVDRQGGRLLSVYRKRPPLSAKE